MSALKPLEKELGIVTSAEREAASTAKVTQGQKGAEISKSAPRPSTTGAGAGKAGGATATAGKAAQGIEEEVIKRGKLAEYNFEHRGHTLRILKDGRIVRCSKICTFTSLQEQFGDLIGRHSHLNAAMTKLKALTGDAAIQEAANLGRRMETIDKAERLSLKQVEGLFNKPEYAKGTPLGDDIRFVHYQKKGGKLEFEAWKNSTGGLTSLDWAEPLVGQAIKLLPATDVKAFPYLRRLISLGRNKDIAKAVDALSDVEAAEITSLMRAVEVGKLGRCRRVAPECPHVKVEGNLKGSIPGLRVIGRMKEHDRLVRAAENLGEATQREADDLIEQYLRGNTNPGIGTKHLAGDIFYLRGNRGARVFYRENAQGYMEILAKTDKREEASVIKAVLEYSAREHTVYRS